MRIIERMTIGTIVQKRIIEKSKYRKMEEVSVPYLALRRNVANKLCKTADTIPTDSHDLQLWAIAFVQSIDSLLARRGYWIELPLILDILDYTSIIKTERDITHD